MERLDRSHPVGLSTGRLIVRTTGIEIGLFAVVLVNLGGESSIRHVRPTVLVEVRRSSEFLLIDASHEVTMVAAEGKRICGHRVYTASQVHI